MLSTEKLCKALIYERAVNSENLNAEDVLLLWGSTLILIPGTANVSCRIKDCINYSLKCMNCVLFQFLLSIFTEPLL